MSQQLTHHVDIALCIDCTGSMRSTLAAVKETATNFHALLEAKMRDKGKQVTQLRIRVIAFRDLFADDPAFEISEFFVLPDESTKFSNFLEPLKAKGGGGDGPESALEALSIALNSAWSTDADRLRHVIVMWTDALPHPLERGAEKMAQSELSDVLASDLNQLTDWWEDKQGNRIDNAARRLVIFAPEKGSWIDLADEWSSTVFFPSQAGKGLRDFELEQIIDLLANSI